MGTLALPLTSDGRSIHLPRIVRCRCKKHTSSSHAPIFHVGVGALRSIRLLTVHDMRSHVDPGGLSSPPKKFTLPRQVALRKQTIQFNKTDFEDFAPPPTRQVQIVPTIKHLPGPAGAAPVRADATLAMTVVYSVYVESGIAWVPLTSLSAAGSITNGIRNRCRHLRQIALSGLFIIDPVGFRSCGGGGRTRLDAPHARRRSRIMGRGELANRGRGGGVPRV